MNAQKNQEDLIGAAAIAKALELSDAKTKKLIKELKIEPAAKRGICNFYSPDAIGQIRKALSQK